MFSGSTSSADALWSIFYLLMGALVTLAGYGIKTWPLIKARLTEAKLADDQITNSSWKRWQDEVARLDARIIVLEKKLVEAERRALTAETEKARLEAFITGRGEGRQEAAIFVSARRIVERDNEAPPEEGTDDGAG